MHAILDQEARDLAKELRDLGFLGARLRARAIRPEFDRDTTRRGLQWNTTEEWWLTIRVRYLGQEVWVERSESTPANPKASARSLVRIFHGAFSGRRYRSEELSDRTSWPRMTRQGNRLGNRSPALTLRINPGGEGVDVGYLNPMVEDVTTVRRQRGGGVLPGGQLYEP